MNRKTEMIDVLRKAGYSFQEIKSELNLTTPKRAELLQVATQLAAGMNDYDYYVEVNEVALKQAKDLIAKVDKECGE